MDKTFETIFKIGGKIAASFPNSMRSVSRELERLQDQTDKTKKSFKGIGDAAEKGLKIAAAGAVVAGAALSKSMNFNDDLQLMALTANMSAKEMQSFKDAALGAANAAGIMAEDVLAGGSSLIAAGMDAKVAEKMLTTMSRVVVANKANFEDISAATFSMNQQFGIAAEEMENAFNILSQGGKEGQFELKAMAQYLPSIGSRFKAMKIEGMEAASTFAAGMQVMRKNAPDDSQAATMMENMLSYAVSPKGLKYAAEAGSNMKAVIENAWTKGDNPMEAYVKEMARISDGGDAFKLGELVRNDEARQGLQAMIQNYKEYERVKAAAAGAENAGTIDADYNVMGGTAKGVWDTLKANMGTTAIVVGTALEPAFKDLSATISKVALTIQTWASENPELFAQIVKITAYTLALVGGVSALALGVIGLIGPFVLAKGAIMGAVGVVIKLFTGLRYLSTAIPWIMTIAKWMASGLWIKAIALIKMLGTAFMWLGRVFLMNPIGLAITAIIVAIGLLYYNWDTVSKFLVSSWEWVKSAWSSSMAAIASFVSSTWASIKAFFTSGIANITATIVNFSPIGLFYQAFAAVMSYFGIDLPAKFTDFGKMMIQGLINGIGSMVGAVVDKAKAIASAVTNTVKGAFQINSPSRLFEQFGVYNMQGLANGMDSSAGLPQRAASSAAYGSIPSMPSSGSSLAPSGGGSVLQLTQYITVGSGDAAEQAKKGAASGAQDMLAALKEMKAREARLTF